MDAECDEGEGELAFWNAGSFLTGARERNQSICLGKDRPR